MQYAEIDHTQFPIVVIRFLKSEPTSQEFRVFLKDLADLYLCGERFIVIFDATKVKFLSFELRIRQAEFIKKHRTKVARSVIMNLYILPTALQRTILKSIFLIQSPIAPYQIVHTFGEAMQIAKKELQFYR
jgi:hypothetical protein